MCFGGCVSCDLVDDYSGLPLWLVSLCLLFWLFCLGCLYCALLLGYCFAGWLLGVLLSCGFWFAVLCYASTGLLCEYVNNVVLINFNLIIL